MSLPKLLQQLLSLLSLLLLLAACQPAEHDNLGADAGAQQDVATAGWLTHCAACHQLPEPEDLPRAIWDTVILPRMGHFMGRFQVGERERLLASDPAGRRQLLAANVYPVAPVCSDADWQAIRDYYLQRAPLALPQPMMPDTALTDQFIARFPKVFLSPPSTSYLKIFPSGGVMAADINKKSLVVFNRQLEAVNEVEVGPGLTSIMGNFATIIGSFSPTDAATGQLIGLTPNYSVLLADSLQRPTSMAGLNLDADPAQELIVAEYGKWTGKLSRWDRSGKAFSRSVVANRPGAIQVIVDTSATHPTVFVLYGQGQEAIVSYEFLPEGQLNTKVIRSFPPSYGSSSLQFVNWNNDPYPDLLYTNGDNADYRSPLKPYHGIRVYAGSADRTFTEAVFLPLPGAYGAEVADFDQDGDPDVAAISFFPDYTSPAPASAVIFENQGVSGFTSFRLPAEGKGRFLRLVAGDYDLDGDTDLAAASLALEAIPDNGRMQRWLENGLPFIVWENQLK